jgi:hypothetical protein
MKFFRDFTISLLVVGIIIPSLLGFAKAQESNGYQYSTNAAYIIGAKKQGVSQLPISYQISQTIDQNSTVTIDSDSDSTNEDNDNDRHSALRFSKIKISLFDDYDGKIYANNRDYFRIEFSIFDYFGNYLPNQPLIVSTPSGVNVAGDLDSMNGTTELFFRSERPVNARCYVALKNDPRVRKYFTIRFRKTSYKILNRTDRKSFNSDCPITFVAETPASNEFVRAEIVYEYDRLVPVLFWKDVRHQTLTEPMYREGGNWIGRIGGDNTSRSKVSKQKFSYYYRFYDRHGNVFQSKRYTGRLSTP